MEITSPFQSVSLTDFFNKNVFESPTNKMCSKVIKIIYYLPKVVLKLRLMVNYKTLWYIIYTMKEALVKKKWIICRNFVAGVIKFFGYFNISTFF